MSPGHKEGGGGTQPAESRDEGARHTESSQSKGGGSTGGGKAGKVPEAANAKAADREKRAGKEGSKGKSLPTHEKSSTAEKLSAGESVSKRLEKHREKQKPEWRRQEDQRTKEREQRARQQEGPGPSPGAQRDWSKKPPAVGKPLSADSVGKRLTAKQYAGAREKGTPVRSSVKASAVSRQDRALPATEALRQNRIWEKSHALTGKEFQEFVGKKMDSLSPGDRRNAALDLARNLTPADLKSREMATEHGEKALGIIKDELNAKSVKDALKTLRDNPPGPLGPLVGLSDIYKGVAEWRDNKILEKAIQKDAAAFNKEVKRIDDAMKSIHGELHPKQDATAARRQFTDNFPKFAAEIKASIEASGRYKVADVYHKPWAHPDNEEIRAKLTETKRIENPKTGRVSQVTSEKDVCLGGIDFRQRNTFIGRDTIETHGTAAGSYPELVLADLLAAASIGSIAAKGAFAIGKDLAGKAAIRAGESLAAAAAGELRHGGGAVARQLGGALERQAVKNTSKEAFAETISLERGAGKKGVDAFARTEQASVRGTRTFPAVERPTAGGKTPEKTLPPLENAPTGRTLKGWSPEGGPPKGRGTPTEAPLPADRPPEAPVRAGAETGGTPIVIGDAAPKGLGYDTPAGRIEIQRVVNNKDEAQRVRDQVMRGEIPGGWAARSDDIMQGEWRVAGGKGEAPVGWWEKKSTGGSFIYNRNLVGPESGETARIVGQRIAGAARQRGSNIGPRSPFADRGQAARDLPKSAPRDVPPRGQDVGKRLAGNRPPEIATDKATAKNRSPEAFAKTQETSPKGTRTFPAAERPPATRQAPERTLPPLESTPTGRTLGGLGPAERPPAGRPPSGEAPPPRRPPVGGRPPGGETPTLPPLDVPRTAAHARERLAQYGLDARAVQNWENRIRASGASEAEVGRQMSNNADLLDYYARVWNNGDTSNLPRLIWTVEDMGGGGQAASIREAISDQYWVNKVSQYSAGHGEYMARYHQGEVPRAVRRQFSEEADRFARDKVNEFLSRP